MKSTLTQVRSAAIAKANRLQSIHAHLDTLRPAFRAWLNGHVFIGGRGAYRYRADRSLAPWSDLARQLFPTVGDFALAASMLDAVLPALPKTPAPAVAKPAAKPSTAENTRANVIDLAKARRASSKAA